MNPKSNGRLDPMSFLRSILKFSIATWVNAIIYGISTVLISHLLEPSVYGPFDLFLSASNTVMSVAALGLDHSYIRFYHEPPRGLKDNRQLASVCMTVSCICLFACSLLICLVFPQQLSYLFFSGAYYPRLIVLICVNALFLLVSRYFTITYRMRQDTLMYTVQSILLQFFTRMFFLVGSLVRPDLDTIVLFNVAGLGLFTAGFWFFQRKSLPLPTPRLPRTAMPPLFRYGVALAPSTVLNWLNSLFSRLFVNVKLGEAQQGVYSMVSTMTLALGVLQAGFSTFWSAFIFEHYHDEQRKIIRIHDFLMFGVMVLMCGLLMTQHVIFFILGSSYREGEAIFGLMMYAPMLLIVSETTVYGINISKKTYFDAIGMAISVGGNALLCLLLLEPFGMLGAALALALSGAAMFVFRTAVAQRFYKSIEDPKKTALSLTLMALLCTASWYFAASPLLVFALGGALCGVYCLIYLPQLKRCLKLLTDIVA